MAKETWVIVANTSHARFFRLDKGLTLIEKDSLVHQESRMHERDLIADKPGDAYQGTAYGRFPMDQKHSPKKNQATLFAKEVCECIELARAKGDLERVYIAASPSFLGILRKEMAQLTKDIVVSEVDKDITHMKPDEIKEYFPIGI